MRDWFPFRPLSLQITTSIACFVRALIFCFLTDLICFSNFQVERLLPDGTREIIFPNGTRKTIDPTTHHTVVSFFNGDIKQIFPDDRTVSLLISRDIDHGLSSYFKIILTGFN